MQQKLQLQGLWQQLQGLQQQLQRVQADDVHAKEIHQLQQLQGMCSQEQRQLQQQLLLQQGQDSAAACSSAAALKQGQESGTSVHGLAAARTGIALADFDGSGYGSDFISFMKGDEILLLHSDPKDQAQGWSIGYLTKDGTAGRFPTSYWSAGGKRRESDGEIAPPPAQIGQNGYALADFDGTKYGADYISLVRGEGLTFVEQVRDNTSWSIGIRNRDSARGFYPSAYWAQQSRFPTSSLSAGLLSAGGEQREADGEMAPSPAPSGQNGYALADFDGTKYGADYISLVKGEGLTFVEQVRDNKSWSIGIRNRDGARGFYPGAYWAHSPKDLAQQAAGCCARAAMAPAQQSEADRQQLQRHRKETLHEKLLQQLAKKQQLLEQLQLEQEQAEQQQQQQQPQQPAPRTTLAEIRRPDLQVHVNQKMPETQLQLHLNAASTQPSQSLEVVAVRGADTDDNQSKLSSLANAVVNLSKQSQQQQQADLGTPEEQESQAMSVFRVVQAARGKALLANTAAAVLALGIMRGPHQTVCKTILAIVQKRQDLFRQLPPHWKSIREKELMIKIKPEGLQAVKEIQFDLPAPLSSGSASDGLRSQIQGYAMPEPDVVETSQLDE